MPPDMEAISAIVESVVPTVEDVEKAVDGDVIVTTLIKEIVKAVPPRLQAAFHEQLKHVACLSFLTGARWGSNIAFTCVKAARAAREEGKL